MKKWVIVLLVVICFVFVGCSANDDMSSLSEYEMVEGRGGQFQLFSNHKEINTIYGQIKIHKI